MSERKVGLDTNEWQVIIYMLERAHKKELAEKLPSFNIAMKYKELANKIKEQLGGD